MPVVPGENEIRCLSLSTPCVKTGFVPNLLSRLTPREKIRVRAQAVETDFQQPAREK